MGYGLRKTIEQALELVTTSSLDDDGDLSGDEVVGDFVSEEGQSVVLSGETLSCAAAMQLSLPEPSEMDSLLLGYDDEDAASEERGEDKVTQEDVHDPTGNDTPPTPFDFTWAEAEPNSIDIDFPPFIERVGPSDEAKRASTPLQCFQLSLLHHLFLG